MTIQLDKTIFYSVFSLSGYEEIDIKLQLIAPSMLDYYLSDLASSSMEGNCFLESNKIQFTHYLGDYLIHIDYSDNIYLEFEEKQSEYETGSLW